MKILYFYLLIFLLGSCTHREAPTKEVGSIEQQPFLMVLGTIQDGGSPHIGCQRACCRALFEQPDPLRRVVSLGLTLPVTSRTYLFEATPDLPLQLHQLEGENPGSLAGVFLTHAHIGHYSGLQYFGREAMGADGIPVYAMPRMAHFLSTNGPWSQLVALQNILLDTIQADQPLVLDSGLQVTPLLVPHRDEFSETVGYLIDGPKRSALFLPDIDKWERWERSIDSLIQRVDYAFLDATFFDGAELNNRDLSQIPHPFVVESLERFAGLSETERAKIHFIHFNHTNPLLNPDSEATQRVLDAGFRIATIHSQFPL